MAPAAMTTSSALAAAVLIIFCASAFVTASAADKKPKHDEAADLVSQACANVTRDFCRLRLTKESCVSVLRSDKRGAAAAKDLRDLALLAIDLAWLSAAAADSKVGAALRGGPGDDAARRLRYCQVDYDSVARTAPQCRAMVERYKLGTAVDSYDASAYFRCVDRIVDAAVGCRDQVGSSEVMSKDVGKEVDEVIRRATVAKAIQEQMLHTGMKNPFYPPLEAL